MRVIRNDTALFKHSMIERWRDAAIIQQQCLQQRHLQQQRLQQQRLQQQRLQEQDL